LQWQKKEKFEMKRTGQGPRVEKNIDEQEEKQATER
jgi:hypothetical protein